MKLLIVGKPDSPDHQRLVKVGRRLGHRVTVAPMRDVAFAFKRSDAPVLRDKRIDRAFDVVCFRGVHPYVSEALLLAEWCASAGLRVIDRKIGKREYVNSKAYDAWKLRAAGIPAPDGVQPLSRDAARAHVASARFPLVAKGVHGSQGRRVHLCRSAREARTTIDAHEEGSLLFQPFIDVREEYRVLVLGGRVLGAMRKRDIPGDFRRNLALGGEGESADLPAPLLRMCRDAARALGHEFSGADLVVAKNGAPYILEANRAPGFVGFERATGIDVAGAFIRYAAKGKGA